MYGSPQVVASGGESKGMEHPGNQTTNPIHRNSSSTSLSREIVIEDTSGLASTASAQQDRAIEKNALDARYVLEIAKAGGTQVVVCRLS